MSPTGQTADGLWEIGVRRTTELDRDTAWNLLCSLLEGDDAVRGILSETPGSVLRAMYQPRGWSASSTLQLRVLPAATGTTLAIHHERLPSSQAREAMGRLWTDALERLIANAS
jgi:hypothetical protein